MSLRSKHSHPRELLLESDKKKEKEKKEPEQDTEGSQA